MHLSASVPSLRLTGCNTWQRKSSNQSFTSLVTRVIVPVFEALSPRLDALSGCGARLLLSYSVIQSREIVSSGHLHGPCTKTELA